MSAALDAMGSAFLSDLKARAGSTWAKIPDASKALAERTAIRWGALHLAESLGAAPATLLPLAREVDAEIAVLEAEVEELLRSALIAYAESGASVVGKIALAAAKGAFPPLGAALGVIGL